MADILQEVSNRGGFNVSFIQVNESLYSSDDDMLISNMPFIDFFASDSFTDTLQRRESGLAFSSKILNESPVLVTLETASVEETLNLWSFMHPFEYSLWAVVAALIFFNGIVHWIIQEDDKSFFKCWYLSFVGISTNLTWMNVDNRSQVLLNTGYAFSFLVIVAVYCANLASLFVHLSNAQIIYSTPFASLPAANFARASICVSPDALSRSLLAPYPHIRRVYVPDDPALGSAAALLLALRRGRCQGAIVGQADFDILSVQQAFNPAPACPLVTVGGPLRELGGGWPFLQDYYDACTMLAQQAISAVLVDMTADFSVQDLWAQAVQAASDNDNACSGGGSGGSGAGAGSASVGGVFRISLFAMAGPLVVYGACLLAAVASFSDKEWAKVRSRWRGLAQQIAKVAGTTSNERPAKAEAEATGPIQVTTDKDKDKDKDKGRERSGFHSGYVLPFEAGPEDDRSVT